MNKLANLLHRIILLAVLGAIVSAYLVYHHENVIGGYNIGQSFCNFGGSFNCDEVAKSKYSSFFGFPVATFGLCYFLVLLAFSIFVSRKKTHLEAAICVVSISALVALIPSIFLLSVSVFQIKKFCLFCLLLDLILACLLLLTAKFVSRQKLTEVSQLLGSLKIFFVLTLSIALLFSLSAPWAFRSFVLEAGLKKSVIGQIYLAWQKAPIQEFVFSSNVDGLKKDFYLGSDNPKITLVEFSDFQCPFCQIAAHEVKALTQRWPDKLKVVFKNFPLDKLCNLRFDQAPHTLSCQAAVLARCAGLQGDDKFWRFHDALFSLNAEDWTLEQLIIMPAQLGVNQAEIDQCIEEGKALSRVRADVELGNAIGVNSTPAFFINGRRVVLDRLDQLGKLIEMILGQ